MYKVVEFSNYGDGNGYVGTRGHYKDVYINNVLNELERDGFSILFVNSTNANRLVYTFHKYHKEEDES